MSTEAMKEMWDREYSADIVRCLASVEEEAGVAQRLVEEGEYEHVYNSLKYIARECEAWARDIKKDGLNK